MNSESQRFLIVSMPKSGTHYLGGILSTALSSSEPYFIHYDESNKQYSVQLEGSEFGGNRGDWVNFKTSYPFAFNSMHKFLDPELFLYLVRQGEVALSHLTRRQVPVVLDPCFFYICLVRDVEGIIASCLNTEVKIVRLAPRLREPEYADLNLVSPKENDINSFAVRCFNILAPHLLEMLYWQFTTGCYFISYQDIILRSDRLNRLIEIIGNKRIDTEKLFSDAIYSSCFEQTRLAPEDRIVTPDDVKNLLNENLLFRQINSAISKIIDAPEQLSAM